MRSLRHEREDKYKLDQCNKVENWLAKNEIAKYEKKKKSILSAFLNSLGQRPCEPLPSMVENYFFSETT